MTCSHRQRALLSGTARHCLGLAPHLRHLINSACQIAQCTGFRGGIGVCCVVQVDDDSVTRLYAEYVGSGRRVAEIASADSPETGSSSCQASRENEHPVLLCHQLVHHVVLT